MEFRSATGQQEYAALVRASDDLVVGLDFDGTLAPIVDAYARAGVQPLLSRDLSGFHRYLHVASDASGGPPAAAGVRLVFLHGLRSDHHGLARIIGQLRFSICDPRALSRWCVFRNSLSAMHPPLIRSERVTDRGPVSLMFRFRGQYFRS